MRNWKKTLLGTANIAVLVVPTFVGAGTITWGVFEQGVGDFDLYSDGSLILEETFTYELGVFLATGTNTSFHPNAQNTEIWQSNWVPVGDASAFDPFTGAYGGTAGSAAFAGIPTGSQVYVWGFNSREFGEGLEWVLYTGLSSGGPAPTDHSWSSPDPAGTGLFSLEWAPRTATEAVVGRISTTPQNEVGGTITFPAVLGENVIQTAAVPEPSAGALLALFAALFFLRRARRGTL